jgi:hypothetical protein
MPGLAWSSMIPLSATSLIVDKGYSKDKLDLIYSALGNVCKQSVEMNKVCYINMCFDSTP